MASSKPSAACVFPSGPGWKMWTGAARSTWRSPSATWPSSSQTLRRRPNLLRPPLPQQTSTATVAPARTTRSGGAPGRPPRAGRAPRWTEKPTDAPLQSSSSSSSSDDPHSPSSCVRCRTYDQYNNLQLCTKPQRAISTERLIGRTIALRRVNWPKSQSGLESWVFFLCHESKWQVVWLFNYCIVPNTGGRSIGIHRMSLYALCKNVKRSSLNNSLHIDCC